jgi:hypothetical protein
MIYWIQESNKVHCATRIERYGSNHVDISALSKL